MGRSWAFFEAIRVPPFVMHLMDPDGAVGRHFFRDLARRTGADLREGEPDIGIIESVETLRSDDFDPDALDPLVRAVWERTTALEFRAVDLDWSPWMRPFEPVYRWLGHRMGQLEMPRAELLPAEAESQVAVMDVDRDGRTDYRVWLRLFGSDVYYVGAVFTHKHRGKRGEQSYLDVVAPLWRGNVAFVFQPSNLDGGGLRIRTRVPHSYDAGCHLIFPQGERYWMVPFFGVAEEIQVVPVKEAGETFVRATHFTTWLGFDSFQLRYELRPKNGSGNAIRRAPARSRRRPPRS